MRLLDVLIEITKNIDNIVNARTAHFAFAETEVAFLSQLPEDELIARLEQWIADQRSAKKISVH